MKNKKNLINLVIIFVALIIFTFEFTVQTSGFQIYGIATTLVENGNDVAWRNEESEKTGTLLTHIQTQNDKAKIGKKYREELAVKNSGEIDIYTRVSVYVYFSNENGNNEQSLDPKKIDIAFSQSSDWIIDEKVSNINRTVLYYSKVLPIGETTSNFIDSIKLSDVIKDEVQFSEQAIEGNTTIITHSKNRFEGKTVALEVKVEAIQSHNAEDAILKGWNREVSIDSNGNLTLL